MTEEAPQRRVGGPVPKTREDDARGAPLGHFGNPPFRPTEAQRAQVRAYAKTFPPAAEHYIARLMGFSRDTLRRHFADDLEFGRAEMLASVGAQFINRALDAERVDGNGKKLAKGDIDAQKYILARMGGWSSKVELAGRDGGPIEHVDLSRLKPEDLEQYGRLAAIAAGMDPDLIVAVPRD